MKTIMTEKKYIKLIVKDAQVITEFSKRKMKARRAGEPEPSAADYMDEIGLRVLVESTRKNGDRILHDRLVQELGKCSGIVLGLTTCRIIARAIEAGMYYGCEIIGDL